MDSKLPELRGKGLNLGCGENKIVGCLNVDVDPKVKPDKVFDILKKFPLVSDTVDFVLLFHTIEHIEKPLHAQVLIEIFRVLKPGGYLIISYPEFLKCVKNWRTNFHGQQDFWEATLYGRQGSDWDYHVCIMHTEHFVLTLRNCGFAIQKVFSEPREPFNTVIVAEKRILTLREDLLRREIFDDKRSVSHSSSRKSR